MGCSSSSTQTSLSVEVDNKKGSIPKEKSAKRWRQVLSIQKTKEIYISDGCIPSTAPDSVVEFRTYIEDPVHLGNFGKYVKKKGGILLLMCWVDLLTYRQINESSVDYQASAAVDVFRKYVEPGASTLELITYPGVDRSILTSKLVESIDDEIKNFNLIPLSKHLFDPFFIQCLLRLHDLYFTTFRSTSDYKDGISNLKRRYNVVSLDDFEYYNPLGQGSFGFVVHCRKASTGKNYAMKIQTKQGLLRCFSDCPSRVVFEREALAHCQHPFIVSMDYAFQTEKLAIMVMDLGTAGTLADAMVSCVRRRMPEDRVRFYCAEIALALAHIHRMGLIYRDLKPANVLLNADGHIQLVDMGGVVDIGGKSGYWSETDHLTGLFRQESVSTVAPRVAEQGVVRTSSGVSFVSRIEKSIGRVFPGSANRGREKDPQSISSRSSFYNPNSNTKASMSKSNHSSCHLSSYRMAEAPNLKRAKSVMGTNGFMAPEMLILLVQHAKDQKGYSNAVDYWSLGVTMFNLLTGSLPFQNAHVANFMNYIEEHEGDADFSPYPSEYVYVFRKLSSSDGVSEACTEAITGFLEVDEKKRLGSTQCGGMASVQRHPFFSSINWGLLSLKQMPAPFYPFVPEPSVELPPFDNFSTLVSITGKEELFDGNIKEHHQKYFAAWDFISPGVLKTEIGIAKAMDPTQRLPTKHFTPNERTTTIGSKVARLLRSMKSTSSGHQDQGQAGNSITDEVALTDKFLMISPTAPSSAASFGISKNVRSAVDATKMLHNIRNTPDSPFPETEATTL